MNVDMCFSALHGSGIACDLEVLLFAGWCDGWNQNARWILSRSCYQQVDRR